MRKRSSIFHLSANILLFLFSVATLLPAQKPVAGGNGTKLPYCDQVKDLAQKNLQARANLECQTVFQCMDCVDRASETKTCTPLVVQPEPNNAKCRVLVAPVNDMAQNPQKSTATPEPTFKVDIFQGQCLNGQISLQAMVCTTPNAKCDDVNRYKYAWQVDGKPAGSSWSLDCVSGKTVQVTVTQISSGQARTQVMSLKQPPATERITPYKLVAAYKKTSCFGRCPVFTMEIGEDGMVTWTGLQNVSPMGKKTAKAPANALSKLQEKAKAVKFFEMNDRYPATPVLDAPSTVLYLNFNGKEKQVVDLAEAPAGLKELEALFDEIVEGLGWGKNVGTPKPKDTTTPGKGQRLPSGN